MTELVDIDNNQKIVDLAVPSTSVARYSPLQSKLQYRETQAFVQNENRISNLVVDTSLEIVDMETSRASYSQFKMLDKEAYDAVQDKNKYDEILEVVRVTIPSISLTELRLLKPSILQQKLIFEIENIGRIMKVVQTQVNRWLVIIDEKKFPEKEFLQEYLAGADKLHELQCKQIKLKSVQEEIQKKEDLKRLAKETSKTPKILLVHFPNNQHTIVRTKKGLTLRKAVAKAMERRQLTTNDCAAYITCRISYFISWDTDISTLQCKEVFVETLEEFPVPISAYHNFVRNTFLLSYCCICKKRLFYGFHCTTCNRKIHKKCRAYAPALCERVKRWRAYYQRLLANNAAGTLQIRSEGRSTSSTSSTPQPSRKQMQRDSTSTSNTAINRISGFSQIYKKIENSVSQGLFKKWKQRPNNSSAEPIVGHLVASTKMDENSRINLKAKQTKLNNSDDTINQSMQDIESNQTDSETEYTRSHDTVKQSLKYDGDAQSDLETMQEKSNDSVNRGTLINSAAKRHDKRRDKRDKKHNKKRARHTYDTDRAESDGSEKSIFSKNDSIKDWKISPKEISFGSRIGQGAFGTVYKADWYGPIAVKTLNVKIPTEEQKNTFKNEVNVLRKTRHKNILLFIGCISKPHFAIITQWCDGSSLYDHLHIKEHKFDPLIIIFICKEISEGMEYLHSKDIYHRDLKSNNIFFQNGLHVKIGDFGLAALKNDVEMIGQTRQPAGSVLWMAPEVIRMREPFPYSFKSDVYSYGIVMYELCTSKLPYRDKGYGKDQIMFMVGKGDLRPDLTKIRPDIPNTLQKLLKRCIAFEREDRPEFLEIWNILAKLYQKTPKIRKTTSVPNMTDKLPDTYIQKENQFFNFPERFVDRLDI
ncbi:hypothetical protein P5V15_010683 [Pogonomyrmex californicus]